MTEYPEIAKRFAAETDEHGMRVLLDDGLYRHLRFKASGTSMYWFDLITVPGALIFQGDGESYVFRRLDDMFEFFRDHRINPSYWWEKVTSNRDSVMRYDADLFERKVREHVAEDIRHRDAPRGIGRAIAEWLADLRYDGLIFHETEARQALDAFAFYEEDELGNRRKQPSYEFTDTWEWSFRDYDWWFLWACHAIVWGIRQYDATTATAQAVAS